MSAVVTIHQPEHLPWLGFFAKMARADCLVSLDCVPYRRRYFQNRNRVLGSDGSPVWLTVPVHAENHFQLPIAEVRIVEEDRWRRKYARTLEHRYGGDAPGGLCDDVARTVAGARGLLSDLNHELISILRDALGIRTPIVRATALGGTGRRSELLAELTRRVGGSVYLSGPSGREYLDPRPFERLGIEIWFHDYDHPVYPQAGSSDFVSHLSALDLIVNCGAEAQAILMSGSRVTPASEADFAAIGRSDG